MSAIQEITSESVGEDAPETPAPIFALRAFKHALFGTPKPADTERKPRRRDYDGSRPSRGATNKDAQATRPRIAHTKSASALTSPAKGILLTPGTANSRRKTVSFGSGEQLRAQFGKEARDRATPREIPGRFPTPYTTKMDVASAPDAAFDNAPQSVPAAGRGNLADDHDSLSRRFKRLSTGSKSPKGSKGKSTIEIWDENQAPPLDDVWVDASGPNKHSTVALHDHAAVDEPRSEDGKYWKEQYSSFATKSIKEMKKLVKKEQIARKFAKDKERELIQCQQELAQNRRTIAELRGKRKASELAGSFLLATTAPDQATIATSYSVAQLMGETVPTTAGINQDAARRRANRAEEEPPPRQDEQVFGSDIWVEAAASNNPRSARRPRRKPATDRAIDGQQSVPAREGGTEAATETRPEPTTEAQKLVTVAKASASANGMSDERREAARKRLEERKKQREAATLGGS